MRKHDKMFGNRYAAKEEPRTKKITIRLTAKEDQALRQCAEEASATVSQICRDAILGFLRISEFID